MARRKQNNPAQQQINAYAMEIGGDRAVRIAQCLGDGATDEKIEKKTKLKVAEIRAVLNQLHQHGVVDYTREKNMENGWFTYTWRIDADRAMRNLLSAKKQQYQKLRDQMQSEEGTLFYKCRKSCLRMAFDDAMESDFRCPECKGQMRYANNNGELKGLEQKIGALEQILQTDTVPENN